MGPSYGQNFGANDYIDGHSRYMVQCVDFPVQTGGFNGSCSTSLEPSWGHELTPGDVHGAPRRVFPSLMEETITDETDFYLSRRRSRRRSSSVFTGIHPETMLGMEVQTTLEQDVPFCPPLPALTKASPPSTCFDLTVKNTFVNVEDSDDLAMLKKQTILQRRHASVPDICLKSFARLAEAAAVPKTMIKNTTPVLTACQCQPGQIYQERVDQYPDARLQQSLLIDEGGQAMEKRVKNRRKRANQQSFEFPWCHIFIADSLSKLSDFAVSGRIIGRSGAHTKGIYEATNAKIRLRGKSSGHFERRGKQAPAPLTLAISGHAKPTWKEDFVLAMEMSLRLLVESENDARSCLMAKNKFLPEGHHFFVAKLNGTAHEILRDLLPKWGLFCPASCQSPESRVQNNMIAEPI